MKLQGTIIIIIGILLMVYDWNCRSYHAIGFSLLATPMAIAWGVSLIRKEKRNEQ